MKTDQSNRIGLVVTTIGDGTFLDVYANKLIEEEMAEETLIIVIPDRKTDAKLFPKVKEVERRGIMISCPTLEEQGQFLRPLGEIQHIIPYDSSNRRNIGYLMALEKGCEILISIDDDNLPQPSGDFFKEHLIVTQTGGELEAVHSTSKWFNICQLLNMSSENVYPRGFPYHQRHQNSEISYRIEGGQVHLNAGLWLKDPDVDALTWLDNPAEALSFKGKSVLLGDDVWSPINTQNTSVHRDAVTAFYFVRMDYPIMGSPIGRYGDIFGGYFCQACVRHLGYRIRVGTPVAEHIRNPHNHLKDLTKEFACTLLLKDITEWLQEIKLEGITYIDTYLSLASLLEDAIERFSGFMWNEGARGYFHYIAYCMRAWIKAIRNIVG